MFNVLISADETAWESEQRMGMQAGRFLEHSGDESEGISLDNAESLKSLEHVQSLLLYEDGVNGPRSGFVRVGQMRDIRAKGGKVTFRFNESARIPREQFDGVRERLQISDWEMGRTHWAVKDGDILQDVLALMTPTPKRYDVVLSFAGEDRDYVELVAEFLELHSVVVFYDKYEEATLWGKDLAEHLDGVYRKQGRFCVMFISRAAGIGEDPHPAAGAHAGRPGVGGDFGGEGAAVVTGARPSRFASTAKRAASSPSAPSAAHTWLSAATAASTSRGWARARPSRKPPASPAQCSIRG